jgi:hypothetical protein
MTKLTTHKINNNLQLSSEYVCPHPYREFWLVFHDFTAHLFCSLGDFDPKVTPPNRPLPKSTITSNFLQGVMSHIHIESFGRFFVGKLSTDLTPLVILTPNMHDQTDHSQNRQWTPSLFRECLPTPIPRVLADFPWVSFPPTLLTW